MMYLSGSLGAQPELAVVNSTVKWWAVLSIAGAAVGGAVGGALGGKSRLGGAVGGLVGAGILGAAGWMGGAALAHSRDVY